MQGFDGAVVTFQGVVRNNTRGRATLRLDYECYEAMAIRKMAEIGRAIAAEFAISRIAMVHRLGTMQVGEASVVVIATGAAPKTGVRGCSRRNPIVSNGWYRYGRRSISRMAKSGLKESGTRMLPAQTLRSAQAFRKGLRRVMRRVGCMLRYFLPAALGMIACYQTAWSQDSAPIRVDVRLVRILATVKDQTGAPVGSLEKTSFAVRDNGALQQIAVFERETEQPLSIAILIDTSGSTAKDLKYETESVTRFVRAVMRSGNPLDMVALYSFNWEVVKQTGFTRDATTVDHQLRQLHGEAGTSLYDAILLASRDIEERQGRKVLRDRDGDGGDTTSRTSFQRAAEAAQLAG